MINASGDFYEQEADRISEWVMSQQAAHQPLPTTPLEANHSGEVEAPPIVNEVLHSSGQPLDASTRRFMEPRFGHDFGRVRVHAHARAANAARAVQARAYTLGRDIVFASGEYEPATAAGQRLLAHELVHVLQQREEHGYAPSSTKGGGLREESTVEAKAETNGARAALAEGEQPMAPLKPRQNGETSPAVLQRSAVASWTDATDDERLYFLSESKRKQYLKEQAKLKENKIVKSPVALPQVEKIMNLSANYHHYDEYPTPEGGRLKFDPKIVGDVQKQFRMGVIPDFWPNIKWKAKDGQIHDIGVRFQISFIRHALEPTASNVDNYVGASLYSDKDVHARPQDNIVLMRDIDKLKEYGLNTSKIVSFAASIGIDNFVYDSNTNLVTYTPSASGAAAVTYRAYEDSLTIIKLVREEARAQNLEAKLQSDVLGYASDRAVTFDTDKTGASKTFNKYERMEGITDYSTAENTALAKKTTKVFSDEEARQRLVAVVTHEIGHNIGMGHTDFGIMTESTEKDTFVKEETNLTDTSGLTSGTTINFTPRIVQVSLETGVESMTAENVQLLVNRMQAMTNYVLPLLPADASAQKPELQGFSKTPIAELKPLLQANNYAAIFANDLYIALLAIPYQKPLLDALVSKNQIMSPDRDVIRNGMATEGRLTFVSWQQLSQVARTYIKDETIRMIDRSFSGVSFFSSEQERDAY